MGLIKNRSNISIRNTIPKNAIIPMRIMGSSNFFI